MSKKDKGCKLLQEEVEEKANNRTVDIMGIPFKVEYVDVVAKGENLAGQINFGNATIRIDGTLSAELKMQTLLHEITHQILYSAGLYDLYGNENLVQSIATGIHQVLRANKWIMDEFNCEGDKYVGKYVI